MKFFSELKSCHRLQLTPASPSMDDGWRGPPQTATDADWLKRYLSVTCQEGLFELQNIAQSFEETVYTSATSQVLQKCGLLETQRIEDLSDYLWKIALRMLTLDIGSQNAMAWPTPCHQTKLAFSQTPTLSVQKENG
ncbi:hypothetical protein L6164_003392 [Bauhinia variegata]|uniref:Uncharacterized protein n=1 Tax=Bauhinia variegata TaxID=167791 RepID=A0ACB9Q1T5_BAUVA|nr:hypothetical protein L6164_003392 [Bauhinia variegata]